MPKPSTFKTWIGKRVRPLSPATLQSEIIAESGYAIEVVRGGGDGVRLHVAGGDQDPFSEEAVGARSIECRPGAMLVGEFTRCGVRWPANGLAVGGGTSREVELRIFREKAAARVELLSGELLQHERKLLKNNSSSALADNLEPGDRHVIFQTSGYLPLPNDHWTTPGVGVPFREDEGWLEIVLGASGAVDSSGITQAPVLIVYAQHRLQNVVGARSLWWLQRLTPLPVGGSGLPAVGDYSTSWRWSYTPHSMQVLSAASGVPPITQRIPYPPNGCRIEIYNPSENTEDLQWEGSVYVSGRP